MSRLCPETPASYRPLDPPSGGGRTGADPACVGAFEEALRRATAADPSQHASDRPAVTDQQTDADQPAVTGEGLTADQQVATDQPSATDQQTATGEPVVTDEAQVGSAPDEPPAEIILISGERPADDARAEERSLPGADEDDPTGAAGAIGAETPSPIEEPSAGPAVESGLSAPAEAEPAVAAERPEAEAASGRPVARKKTPALAPTAERPRAAEGRELPAAGAPLDPTAEEETSRREDSAGETAETQRIAQDGAERERQGSKPADQAAASEPKPDLNSASPQAAHDGKRGRESKTNRKGERVQSPARQARSEEGPAAEAAGADRSEGASGQAAPPVAAAADPAIDKAVTRVAGSPPAAGFEEPLEPQAPVADEQIVPDGEGAKEATAPASSSRLVDAARPATGPDDQAQSSRFVQRVVDAFAAISHRGGAVRLRLYPPELGSLRVEITVKHGKLSARVDAASDAARNLLVENLPLLRERLAAQDIKLERFEVNVHDDSQRGASERSDDGGPPWRERRQDAPWRAEINKTEEPTGADNPRWRTGGGRLDVVI